MKLGIVTYNIAKDWDLPTILRVCSEVGLEGVELRTTHAHKVEVDLAPEERRKVKAMFDDSPVEIAGLGSAFDYHSADPENVRTSIAGTKEYVKLAADIACPGVKVRPNGLPEGVPVEKTLEQIGLSLREVGGFAADYGVQIRLEVHGRGTSHVPYIRQIMDIADHDNVYVCWNSNRSDMDENGKIEDNFDLVKDKIGLAHITSLYTDYPWRVLFRLLQDIGYQGYTLAELPKSFPDVDSAILFLRYYRALWQELCR
jgi:sugar phosphate isomerase/epimerase